jgi:hypothetical protein
MLCGPVLRGGTENSPLLLCAQVILWPMSVTVLHNGQRKKVKTSPSSTVQFIADEAARAFQLDPALCELQHNRKILDKGQLFRFSGVSNNATLDLLISNNVKSGGEVKIALTAEDLGSRTAVFR